ncbi:hypothetical protein [Caviibacterium pharyngocola]|uniref:Uncharacterized protein n=1 Tax=Caviibacterium pharyngocola TaxID=28159 RepID=A0A2M8RWN2_9PAST|nr:hypothetical protein [Caviibacterium pharyngocola]PJG83296.1 hypothetical protein CVP04_04015 [Caviibacterium pharyngocola]
MSKQSSSQLSSLASSVLRDPNSSQIQKKLAGSVLAQTNTDKITSSELETKASKALNSEHYSDITKSLAGSVLSQSSKNR